MLPGPSRSFTVLHGLLGLLDGVVRQDARGQPQPLEDGMRDLGRVGYEDRMVISSGPPASR